MSYDFVYFAFLIAVVFSVAVVMFCCCNTGTSFLTRDDTKKTLHMVFLRLMKHIKYHLDIKTSRSFGLVLLKVSFGHLAV